MNSWSWLSHQFLFPFHKKTETAFLRKPWHVVILKTKPGRSTEPRSGNDETKTPNLVDPKMTRRGWGRIYISKCCHVLFQVLSWILIVRPSDVQKLSASGCEAFRNGDVWTLVNATMRLSIMIIMDSSPQERVHDLHDPQNCKTDASSSRPFFFKVKVYCRRCYG